MTQATGHALKKASSKQRPAKPYTVGTGLTGHVFESWVLAVCLLARCSAFGTLMAPTVFMQAAAKEEDAAETCTPELKTSSAGNAAVPDLETMADTSQNKVAAATPPIRKTFQVRQVSPALSDL